MHVNVCVCVCVCVCVHVRERGRERETFEMENHKRVPLAVNESLNSFLFSLISGEILASVSRAT